MGLKIISISILKTKMLFALVSTLVCLMIPVNLEAQTQDDIFTIYAGGNSFITKNAHPFERPSSRRNRGSAELKDRTFAMVEQNGILFVGDNESVASTYFYAKEEAKTKLSIEAKGIGTIIVSYKNKSFTVKSKSEDWQTIKVGKISIKEPAYVKIDVKCCGLKSGEKMQIRSFTLDGLSMQPYYIAKDFSYHFGRRGPSVHLQYQMPKESSTEWFYNEVTVPEDGDVIGSYYCAQGFNGGYFGFQNNSPTERRVLFSIWSPFDTQNPQLIPEESRVKLIRKGEKTHIGEFGNEGSGAQSFLVYPWKAGNTYKFLLHVKPNGDNTTNFSAYFYATEENQWILVAEFLRPETNTYVSGEYSFVENFSPEQGFITRKAFFGNPWCCSKEGKWIPILNTSFTNDETGHRGTRVDYLGGIEDKRFFLKMGGFFGNGTTAERNLHIDHIGDKPNVEFSTLP